MLAACMTPCTASFLPRLVPLSLLILSGLADTPETWYAWQRRYPAVSVGGASCLSAELGPSVDPEQSTWSHRRL